MRARTERRSEIPLPVSHLSGRAFRERKSESKRKRADSGRPGGSAATVIILWTQTPLLGIIAAVRNRILAHLRRPEVTRRLLLSFLPVILVLSLSLSSAASARTWYVKADGTGDAPTIQAGIDSASALDTVLVAPGTYYEYNIAMKSGICLHGEEGAENTVINGQDQGHIIYSFEPMSPFTEISGLTISWGDSWNEGGGILCYGGELTIKDNIIYACSTHEMGGGIRLSGCDATIVNNEIHECYGWEWGSGAGIYCSGSSPLIVGNAIWGCVTGERGIGYGGGIYARDGTVFISGNGFGGNWSGRGGGLYLRECSGEISWNEIKWNYAGGYLEYDPEMARGGGVYAGSSPGLRIAHNTIVSNTAENEEWKGEGEGGGLYVDASVSIENNIVAYNSAPTGGGGIYCRTCCPAIQCNDFWSNSGGSYGGECSDFTGVDGNISRNPMFCDATARDYTLHCESPCLHPAGCDSMGALGEGCGDCLTGIEAISTTRPMPSEPVLVGNHPNPFNPSTTLVFGLPDAQDVRITVYDVNGRRVRELLNDRLDAGFGTARWDGRDASGQSVAAGVYFSRMQAAGKVMSKKMVMVK